MFDGRSVAGIAAINIVTTVEDLDAEENDAVSEQV